MIDKLPLHPKFKIQILTGYIFRKIRWTLTIYEFPITSFKQRLDSSILYYICRWLKFHPGANTMHLTLPLNQLGAGVTLISELFQKCLLSKRTLLKGSNSADVRKLYYLSAEKHVEISQTLEEYTNFFSAPLQARKKNVSKAQEKKRQISVWNQFMGLKEQSLLIKEILDICQPKTILQCQKVTQHLPSNIFSFCRRCLIVSLPTTNSNLSRWKTISNETCTLCENVKQTQRHVISCCPKALEDGRYTWRHNSVLYALCHHLSVAVSSDDKLYADLIGFQTPTVLFRQHRPDACIVTSKGEMYVIEFTVCYEHNTTKAREYKEQRYRNLQDEIEIEYSVFKVVFIEITTLGLDAKNHYRM